MRAATIHPCSLSSRRALAATLLALCVGACGGTPAGTDGAGAGAPLDVVFVAHAAETSLDAEGSAALAWLRAQPTARVRFVALADLAEGRLDPASTLWWHYAADTTLPSAATAPDTLTAVREHLRDGGALLVSLLATPWLVALDLEDVGPDLVERQPGTYWARWEPPEDRLLAGMQSYRGHPLLRRFWGGALTASLHPERAYPTASWSDARWPQRGRVVAVGRRYIGLDPGRKVVVEYPPDGTRSGRALAIGEGFWFADADNTNRAHLELLAADALTYLAGGTPPAPPGASVASGGAAPLPAATTMAGPDPAAPEPPGATGEDTGAAAPDALPAVLRAVTYWQPRTEKVRAFEPETGTAPTTTLDASVVDSILSARSGLALERENTTGEAFDLASPRALLVGRDTGHVQELWGYPARILRDLRFGLVADDGAVTWLHETPGVRLTARPEGNTFRFTTGDATVDLHLSVPRDRAGLVALLAITSERPLRVRASWEIDHGLMWPREAAHLGDLLVGWSQGEAAVAWRDTDRLVEAFAGFNVPPVERSVGVPAPPPAPVEPDPTPAEAAASDARSTTAADGGEGTPQDSADATAPDEAALDADATDTADDADDVGPPTLSRRVSLDVEVASGSPTPLAFAVAARAEDDTDARAALRATLNDPAATWTSNANYWGEFLASTMAVASPDPTLNEAFRWAKVGLEAFRVTTPGLGTGLAAGYAAARRAEEDEWAANNDFLRRPGYAWYFGRDAVWTALAADAYGGSDLSAESLRLLARYQDVDGKIFHELSPSLVLHYDAADSTPLFVLGLDHHIRTTGDRELLRELWPSVRRAMQYMESTDTDGDGLIENTDVGHGWIEGGKFYGAHTTFYLAGVWAATLQALERMAGWMGDEELRATAAERAVAVRQTVNQDFWDASARFFSYGKRADGTFMPYRTIMPAVPALLGVIDDDKMRPLAEMFGSAEITADWGSRMAERSSPDYDPARYHQGSVWPLYTGWTSLASYAARRPRTGFLQAYANLRLVRHGALGFITEALHGEVMEPTGVTQHQAWSHAMAVLPVVQGMLGIRPDAMNGRLEVHPQIPAGWREITAQRVRVGASVFNITVVREDETSAFRLERVAGNEPVQLDLSLPFPRAVLVNLDHDRTTGVAIPEGEEILDRPTEKRARVLATLTEPQGVVTFRHSPYPEVMQPLPNPVPGGGSESLRILESRYIAGALNVRVEGLPGRPYRFNVATPWALRAATGPRGTRLITPGPGRATVELQIPGSGSDYRRADVTLEFRR